MNERALKTLEYDKIIEQLKKHAGSEMGRALCGKLVPQTDLDVIKQMQQKPEMPCFAFIRRAAFLLTECRISAVH